MEEQKTLILSVDFQSEQALDRAAALRFSIDQDKAALKAMNEEIKNSGVVSLEQIKSREKLEAAIRDNTKARATEIKAIESYTAATKTQLTEDGKRAGSIKEMRAELSFLTEKWNGLSRAQRENAAEGGVLQKELKSLSDELKELEGSVGDNRRSVGGYLDAIKAAPGAMGKFKAGINGISTAMAANPLGLILQFLPQIQALFESSGDGADAFAEAMGMVNAVIQEGLKRVVGLGTALFKLLTGDFKGAFAEGQKALAGFGDAITKAVKEGGALAKSLDELEARERAFGLAGAETERQINKLLIQSKNRKTSEAERIKLLERAEQMELQRNKTEIKLAEDRVKLVERENKSKQEDSDKQDERLKKAQENVIKLQQQTDSILEKIQNRKDALADAAEEKRKAAHEKQVKQFEENRKNTLEEIELFQELIKNMKEGRDKAAEEEKKRKDDEHKARVAQMEASSKLNDKELADLKRLNAEKDKNLKLEEDRKKEEAKMLTDLGTASSNLFAALAEENANFAEFEKALSLFKIGVASAEAITKGIAASQNQPFPFNLVAMATTVATVSANLLQAKQLIEKDAPKPPKSKMADGGVLEGPSHAQGGITGTGSFAGVEAEGNEIILTKGVYQNKGLFAIANLLNMAGGGKPLAPTSYAAAGGILSPSAIQPLTGGSYMNAGQAAGIDYNELAKAMAAQPVYVRPTEITSLSNKTNARKAQATIG